MDINVSTKMGFENRDFLRNTAKEILQNKGMESEKASEIAKTIVYSGADSLLSSELNILKSATQVTLNNSLKETLKYLQAHAKDKRKKYVLGELWEQMEFSQNEDNTQSELIDFDIDYSMKNIFAA